MTFKGPFQPKPFYDSLNKGKKDAFFVEQTRSNVLVLYYLTSVRIRCNTREKEVPVLRAMPGDGLQLQGKYQRMKYVLHFLPDCMLILLKHSSYLDVKKNQNSSELSYCLQQMS